MPCLPGSLKLGAVVESARSGFLHEQPVKKRTSYALSCYAQRALDSLEKRSLRVIGSEREQAPRIHTSTRSGP